jgi:hypothetical protein
MGGGNTPFDSSAKGFAGMTGVKNAARALSGLGEDATPETTQSQRYQVISQIQDMLVSAAKNRNGGTMVVRLDPPELGQVTLKVTQRSDQLHARLVSENAEVDNILRQRMGEITHLLASTGFKPENILVSFGTEMVAPEWSGFSKDTATGEGNFSEDSSKNGGLSDQGDSEGMEHRQDVYSVAQDQMAGWVA